MADNRQGQPPGSPMANYGQGQPPGSPMANHGQSQTSFHGQGQPPGPGMINFGQPFGPGMINFGQPPGPGMINFGQPLGPGMINFGQPPGPGMINYGQGQPSGPPMANYGQGQPSGPPMANYGQGQPSGPPMANYGQGQPSGPPMANYGQGQPSGPPMANNGQVRKQLTTSDPEFTCVEQLVVGFAIFLCVILSPWSLFACFKMAQEYERIVVFRVGKMMGKPHGPGLVCIIPCTDIEHMVDLRVKTFDVPPQEVLTRDSVTVRIDAIVVYRISNPAMSISRIVSADAATKYLAQTHLRSIVGTKILTQVLSDREEMSQEMSKILDEDTDPWGIKVDRVEIKDIHLPNELQRAMAAEGEAVREAKARVIAAEGEMNSSRKLKEAADIMAENPQSLSLRFLQTMNTISAEKNSTIVFPLPIKMLPTYNK